MRLKKVRNIFQKEVLDTLRDRRTLMMMIVVPVLLYPGLMLILNEVAATQIAKMEQKVLKVVVLHMPENSSLIDALRKAERVEIVTSQYPIEAVKTGEIHFVLELPPEIDHILQQKKSATIQLYYDQSNDDATTNLPRLRKIIDGYNQRLLDARLSEKSLTREFVKPVETKEVNVASKQKMGGFVIGRFLPMIMVLMVLVGAMYPAIDMTAGEKERGTLETILTSPATRTEIVLGKFLTVSLIALLTGLLNMGSMMATLTFGIFKEAATMLQIKIPLHSFLVMFLCLIPLAVFFSGMMMAVASFAKSFKEAQNLLTPIYLISTVPVLIVAIPGIQLEGFWTTVPVANVTLLFKELMLGTFDVNHILIVFFSITFLACIALSLAINLFGREEVLFGEVSSFGLSFRRSNIRPKPLPDKPESVFLSVVALILFLYVCIPLQSWNLVYGLLLTQLIVFFLLPIGFAYYLKLDLRETFRLRLPRPDFIWIVLVFFVGIEFSIGTILYVQNQIFPIPRGLLESLEKLTKVAQSYPFPLVLLVVALLPSICEELTFRGIILSGMLRGSRPWTAAILTAAMFAVFHVSLHRFLPVFLIGLAAAFLVIQSCSLVPAMLLHFLHNGWIAAVGCYPKWDVLHLLQPKPSASTFLAGVFLIVLGVFWLKRTGRSVPEAPPS